MFGKPEGDPRRVLAEFSKYRLTCLPPPKLFCAEILAAFETRIVVRDLNFVDLIHLSPGKRSGMAILRWNTSAAASAVTPMFKHHSTDAQLAAVRRAGVSRELPTTSWA
jgi:hypothetical protein